MAIARGLEIFENFLVQPNRLFGSRFRLHRQRHRVVAKYKYKQSDKYPWVIARVSTEGDDNNALQKAEKRMADSGIAKVKLESRQEKPEIGLVDCQQENNVDVTVMGAFSHHPLRGFIFGSFTEKMLKQAIKPLLLIHA